MPDAQATSRPLLLKGKSVGLAVMIADDIPIIARWNQDLEFTARIGNSGEAHTLEMRQEAFTRNARFRQEGAEFVVIEMSSGRPIGFGSLRGIAYASVGCCSSVSEEKRARRKGYGAEATRLICGYGFFFGNLHSIKLEVHDCNEIAKRTYERLGFKIVGRLRGANLLDNRRYDEIIMDLLRSGFEPSHVDGFSVLKRLDN